MHVRLYLSPLKQYMSALYHYFIDKEAERAHNRSVKTAQSLIRDRFESAPGHEFTSKY